MHRLRDGVSILFASAMLLLASQARAQDASLIGTITDSTGAALPGATVTATHVATSNQVVATTGGSGEYRLLGLRIGVYEVRAELVGFTTVRRTGIELLVGQRPVIDLQLQVSGVEESITVSGQSPLLETTRSSLGGNVDSRQMQDLPVLGRNWLYLTLAVPGSRANSTGSSTPTNDRGGFQLNVDGQQVTAQATTTTLGQPRFCQRSHPV